MKKPIKKLKTKMKKDYYKDRYLVVKEMMRKNYLANREKILARTKTYYLRNREKILKREKEYYLKNRIAILKKEKGRSIRIDKRFKNDTNFREIFLKRLERTRIANQKRNKRQRNAVLQVFGKIECIKCGFNDLRALHIDHKKGGGNKERQSFKDTSKYYEHIKSHLQDYQLLCANCNFIKKYEETEARKTQKYR